MPCSPSIAAGRQSLLAVTAATHGRVDSQKGKKQRLLSPSPHHIARRFSWCPAHPPSQGGPKILPIAAEQFSLQLGDVLGSGLQRGCANVMMETLLRRGK